MMVGPGTQDTTTPAPGTDAPSWSASDPAPGTTRPAVRRQQHVLPPRSAQKEDGRSRHVPRGTRPTGGNPSRSARQIPTVDTSQCPGAPGSSCSTWNDTSVAQITAVTQRWHTDQGDTAPTSQTDAAATTKRLGHEDIAQRRQGGQMHPCELFVQIVPISFSIDTASAPPSSSSASKASASSEAQFRKGQLADDDRRPRCARDLVETARRVPTLSPGTLWITRAVPRGTDRPASKPTPPPEAGTLSYRTRWQGSSRSPPLPQEGPDGAQKGVQRDPGCEPRPRGTY